MNSDTVLRTEDFLEGRTVLGRKSKISAVLNMGLGFPSAVYGTYLSMGTIADKMANFWVYMHLQHGIDLPYEIGAVPYVASILGGVYAFAKLEQAGTPVLVELLNKMEGRVFFKDDAESAQHVDWQKILEDAGLAVGHSHALNAIEKTLILMDAPYGRHDVDDDCVILCHMKDLRKALGLVYGTMKGERPVRQFTVFHDGTRGLPSEAAPAALHVREDGTAVAVWTGADGMPSYSIAYDADGKAMIVGNVSDSADAGVAEPPFEVPTLERAAGMLGIAIGERHRAIQEAWEGLWIDAKTHKATVADDCVVVRSRATNKVDNPHGPAVLLADGRRLFYRDGRKAGGQVPAQGAKLSGLAAQPAF